jgi:hypothetical protein
METSHSEQRRKENECQILDRARALCPLFPTGNITFSERPDFRIETDTGSVGIEVTQLFRLRKEIEAYHRGIVSLAEKKFYELPGALPIFVNAAFLTDEQCKRENPQGWLRLIDRKTGPKKYKMADSLKDFVGRHVQEGRFGTFTDRETGGQPHADTLPTSFEVIHVNNAEIPAWCCGESANMLLDGMQLCGELSARITEKNEKLRDYRMNTVGMPIWLLIYNGLSLSESFWVPPSISDWTFASDFDKVLLFSEEKRRVFELGTYSSATALQTQT